jgi:transposase InsO family protein
MNIHANATLGPAGRLALVQAIEGGLTQKAAAATFCVSSATANRWIRRWREATPEERLTRSCLLDRSSRPNRSPRLTDDETQARIVEARERTRLGPARLAGLLRIAHSTIWKVLSRLGLSRLRSPQPRETYKRYEWAEAGALLHVDMARLPRFLAPGHRVTGNRSAEGRSTGLGHVYLHCVVDDASRYAYVEQHQAEDGATAAAVLERALRHFQELGLALPEAVMTDNAFAYTKSTDFQALLVSTGARHIKTPPYTPRWNGKVERFVQTLKREWADSQIWESSAERSRALSSFIRYYNRARPHSSLGNRSPVDRVHNVFG